MLCIGNCILIGQYSLCGEAKPNMSVGIKQCEGGYYAINIHFLLTFINAM